MAGTRNKRFPPGKAQASYVLAERIIDRVAIEAVRKKVSRSRLVEDILSRCLRDHPRESPAEATTV